ncbi:hypothetical protein QFC21_000897 [Naganishia friedmannii]|uniref:Uncharacterized protein n=1 Tax=Naganishia friedmannii TaxID=89922 RepID=A0ACC2W8B2_9TREE|nr:hypothetical protein QFC21_000897 [Naganishia friedmannii]
MPFKPIFNHFRSFSVYANNGDSGPHEEHPVNKRQHASSSLSPTLSYYAHFITPTPTPAPPLPNTSNVLPHDLPVCRPSHRLKQKPNLKPIDMSRIERAQSKKIPRVVVTCGLDGQPEEEDSETRRRTVEIGRVKVESVDVKSARASVGDMRLLASSERSKVFENSKTKTKVDTVTKAQSSSPSVVEIEPGHRFPSWMGGTDYHHLLVDNNTTSQSHSTSRTSSPLPRSRATRISPLTSSTASLSPESGGPLHQILLTPMTSDEHSRSTDDLFAQKKRKRRTLTDIAVGLLADQRMRWMKHRPHGHSRGDSFNDLANLPKLPGSRNVREGIPCGQSYSTRSPRTNGNTVNNKVESDAHPQGHNGYELSDLKRAWTVPSEKKTFSRDEAKGKAKRNKWALFTSSASSSPLTYPCSQCMTPLSSATNDFANVTSDKGTPGVGSVLQFCALQAIYKTTEGVNPGDFTAAGVLSGWMKDTGVCTGWTGVECDSQGRITSLSLVYPNVPKSLDPTMKDLVALQSLKIVGNSAIPSGSIPDSALTSTLKTIVIESTALTSLSTKAFAGSFATLQTLLLISNAKLGNSLPDFSSATSLQTFSVTGQSLTENPVAKIPKTVTYLDLSYNSLSGTVPDFPGLSSLKSLFLDANSYTAFPPSLPSSLTELSFNGNTKLNGTVPAGFCAATNLESCDFRGSQLVPPPVEAVTLTTTVAALSRGPSATSLIVSTVTSTATPTSAPSCGVCRFN